MAGGQVWQNSKGEIIQCENGNIAFTEECPCEKEIYLPAVFFTCDYAINSCDYYGAADCIAYVKISNNKIKKVCLGKKGSGSFVDYTDRVKDGTAKLMSYVDPLGEVGELGPFGERSSKVYEDVLCPPQTSSTIDFLTYLETRLACFYEFEKIPWIVPGSWYYFFMTVDYTVAFSTTCITGSWSGSSKRSNTYKISPITQDVHTTDSSHTLITFTKTSEVIIEDTTGLLCTSPYSHDVRTLPISETVTWGADTVQYPTRLTAASYQCCNGYKSPISFTEITSAETAITAHLYLLPDDRLPDSGPYCSWYSPVPYEGVTPSTPLVCHDTAFDMHFVNFYSYGKILDTKQEEQSFKDIKAIASGTDDGFLSGAYECIADGSGTVKLRLNPMINMSRSDSKVSCTYAIDGRMLSLYPIKIEE